MVELLKSRSSAQALVGLFCVLLCFAAFDVEAKVHLHKWVAKYEYRSPDCYQKLVITINGMSPGPTIYAQQGDTVIVELTNSLFTENLAIHWHGITQHGTPWFDGTAAVTQCPIVPGDTFVYKFVVDQAGTFLYHAHYGMQRQSGVFGMIHVALPDNVSEPYHYDYDRSILLADWYHKSSYELAVGLNSIPFVFVGEPQSVLINGKGKFNCSTPGIDSSLCNATNPQCSPYALTVVPGKTYRLRIGSLTSLSALSFQFEGHNMTVVEADGHNVEPFVVQNLFIYSGETYSVIVKTDQNPSRNYWMSAHIVSRNSPTPDGLGFLNYYPNHPSRRPSTIPPTGARWNDTAPRLAQSEAIKALKGYITPPPEKPDRVIVMLNTQNNVNGYVKWSVNNVSFGNMPNTPYLIDLKYKLSHTFDQNPPPEGYDYANYDIFSVPKNVNGTTGDLIYRLKFNSTVDVILQNANTMKVNNSETHPWHLHGHYFWVLGYGIGKFDMSTDPQKYNLDNPILKNTVPVHPYGWTALRFRADNPGVWLFHCHIEAHLFLGMGVVFEEGIEKVGPLPKSILGCGKSMRYFKP